MARSPPKLAGCPPIKFLFFVFFLFLILLSLRFLIIYSPVINSTFTPDPRKNKTFLPAMTTATTLATAFPTIQNPLNLRPNIAKGIMAMPTTLRKMVHLCVLLVAFPFPSTNELKLYLFCLFFDLTLLL